MKKMSMKLYSIYENSDSIGSGNIILVKEGFNWPAGLFPLLWFSWHRIWRSFFLYCFVLYFFLPLIYSTLKMNSLDNFGNNLAFFQFDLLFFSFDIFLFFFIGFNAGALLKKNLNKKGYSLIGKSQGSSKEMAMLAFLNQKFPSSPGRHSDLL